MTRLPLLLLLLPACTTTTTTKQPTEQELFAPIPFTAAQIRAGCPEGHTLQWRVTEGDKAPIESHLTFIQVTDTHATFTATKVEESGAVIEKRTNTAAWDELRMHAAFPVSHTTVEQREVTVPAGTYQCQWYTVRGATAETQAEVHHFCFVLDLPGPPVFFDAWKGEQLVSKSELLAVRQQQ